MNSKQKVLLYHLTSSVEQLRETLSCSEDIKKSKAYNYAVLYNFMVSTSILKEYLECLVKPKSTASLSYSAVSDHCVKKGLLTQLQQFQFINAYKLYEGLSLINGGKPDDECYCIKQMPLMCTFFESIVELKVPQQDPLKELQQ